MRAFLLAFALFMNFLVFDTAQSETITVWGKREPGAGGGGATLSGGGRFARKDRGPPCRDCGAGSPAAQPPKPKEEWQPAPPEAKEEGDRNILWVIFDWWKKSSIGVWGQIQKILTNDKLKVCYERQITVDTMEYDANGNVRRIEKDIQGGRIGYNCD